MLTKIDHKLIQTKLEKLGIYPFNCTDLDDAEIYFVKDKNNDVCLVHAFKSDDEIVISLFRMDKGFKLNLPLLQLVN